jgi:Flp pilus assembly protein TadB
MNITNVILTIASSSIVTFVLSIFAFKYNLIEIKAKTSSTVSQSEQDKITTADKTIDLVEKLRLTMERQFEEMREEQQGLKEKLQKYIDQCSTCSNNKL